MSTGAVLRVPGEDLHPGVAVAVSALGVLAAATWLALRPSGPDVTESQLQAARVVQVGPQPTAAAPEPARPAPPAPCPQLVLRFPVNAHQLTAAEERRLVRLAERLAAEPNATLLVRGHADGAGPDAFNLQLSRRRAEAVQSKLAAAGVARARISAQAFGEYAPLEGTAPTEPENRRATVDVRGASRCLTNEVSP